MFETTLFCLLCAGCRVDTAVNHTQPDAADDLAEWFGNARQESEACLVEFGLLVRI